MGEQLAFGAMPRPLYAASPSRLLAWLDCPRRYRMAYLDRPMPPARPARAHTSVGLSIHNALRDWWDHEPDARTPRLGGDLVERDWVDVGFRDVAQSARWRRRSAAQVVAYLTRVDAAALPAGIERTVSMKTGPMRLTGRIDRLDDRDGELVVVDYKTSRRPSTPEEARTSLALALYAASVWKLFRRRCVRVELHHVPTGTVAVHEHTDISIGRKVAEAVSIATDARAADDDYAAYGRESTRFPPRPGALCTWCDFRAHCPPGQAQGPEKSSWAALETGEMPRDVDGE